VWINRIRDIGISADTPATDVKHIRITNLAALMAAVMIIPWAPVNLLLANWALAIPVISGGIIVLCIFPLNRAGRHLTASIVLMLTGLVQICWGVRTYGMQSDIWAYLILMVFFPYFVFFSRHRTIAHIFAISAAALAILFILFEAHFPPRVFLLPERWQVLLNNSITIIGVAIMAVTTRMMIDRSEHALSLETARADSLLLNVLPQSIATRLKQTPQTTIADYHGEISVLFADIVGFTSMSARLGADRTVKILNQIFTAFDDICDRNGIEKIRTIGDGYMAVAGAPEPRTDHARAITQAALQMREYLQQADLGEPLQVRIGINSGEAVAGIVGTSRFHYDLWGDAVNIAARMESHGIAGEIQIAKPTWERIRDHFECEPRGKIAVKGKDTMETWLVCSAS